MSQEAKEKIAFVDGTLFIHCIDRSKMTIATLRMRYRIQTLTRGKKKENKIWSKRNYKSNKIQVRFKHTEIKLSQNQEDCCGTILSSSYSVKDNSGAHLLAKLSNNSVT